MADVTRTIRYTGGLAGARALVETLERQGVTVDWEPPPPPTRDLQGPGGLGKNLVAVGLGILASGAYDAIKAGVAQFLERFPRAEVVIEDDDDDAAPDDGGFLPDVGRLHDG